MGLKQVIVVRQDLKLPKGKLAVQVAHASTELALSAQKGLLKNWRADGMKKVVLKVADEKELLKYKDLADEAGLNTCKIRDAGKTTVAPGTLTCIGIGPAEEGKIDKITGNLSMV